jgi:hypothetical protein
MQESAALPPDDGPDGVTLALFQTGAREQVRVRQLHREGRPRIDIRAWCLEDDGWSPGDGLTLAPNQLANLRRALFDASWALAGSTEEEDSAGGATGDEIRLAARRVARAREKLEALRAEDYRRPQDYRRACTLRLRDLRREEKTLRELHARLRDSETS